MPLTKCPACGAEVSTKAAECYRCGTKLHNRGRVIVGGAVLLVLAATLWFFFASSDQDNSPSTVSAPSVKPAPAPPPIAELRTLSVTGDRVNFRAGPALDHPVIRQLDEGHALKEIQRQGDWVEVSDEYGNVGWISAEFVSESTE